MSLPISYGLINYVLFQCAWFVCVYGAARRRVWWGPLAAGVVVVVHFFFSSDWRREAVFILFVAALGPMIDTALALTRVYSFSSPLPVKWIAPPWIVSLWAVFATAFHGSLIWLQHRYWTAAALGAIGAPLSYLSAARLGALRLNSNKMYSVLAFGVSWGAAMPFFVWLGQGCSLSQKIIDPLSFAKSALEATQPQKTGTVAPGSPEERRAIERFEDFFANFNEENARKKARDVYAKDVYFNDTLKSIHGIENLEPYLLSSAKNTDSCKVEYLDVVSKDGEYYFRWRMDVLFKKFKKGQTQSSFGISHIRFDPEGKVSYHQDYWDAAGNFFEKLPILGSEIRFIKRRL